MRQPQRASSFCVRLNSKCKNNLSWLLVDVHRRLGAKLSPKTYAEVPVEDLWITVTFWIIDEMMIAPGHRSHFLAKSLTRKSSPSPS